MACCTLAVSALVLRAATGVDLAASMLTILGCPGDYNQWKALGNEGWGYQDLEPYFVKSEKTHSHAPSAYRGKTGEYFSHHVFMTFLKL